MIPSLRTRGVALLVALLVLFARVPGLAAADARAGGDVVVREGRTVGEDLQVFAGSATVRGTVDNSRLQRRENRLDGRVEPCAFHRRCPTGCIADGR